MIYLDLYAGTPTRIEDYWCPRCQFSTLIRVPLNTINEHGVTRIAHLVSRTRCNTKQPS